MLPVFERNSEGEGLFAASERDGDGRQTSGGGVNGLPPPPSGVHGGVDVEISPFQRSSASSPDMGVWPGGYGVAAVAAPRPLCYPDAGSGGSSSSDDDDGRDGWDGAVMPSGASSVHASVRGGPSRTSLSGPLRPTFSLRSFRSQQHDVDTAAVSAAATPVPQASRMMLTGAALMNTMAMQVSALQVCEAAAQRGGYGHAFGVACDWAVRTLASEFGFALRAFASKSGLVVRACAFDSGLLVHVVAFESGVAVHAFVPGSGWCACLKCPWLCV
eukprot:353751-Chlamydomonas_euryale.AAC.14